MTGVLRIFDETATGERLGELTIELLLAEERVTVRELIERRVRAEVRRYNAEPVDVYRGLVQPTDAERVLNGYRLRKSRHVDEEAQVTRALEAFARNGFLLFVGEEQVDELDVEVEIAEHTELRFIKLVPLIGG